MRARLEAISRRILEAIHNVPRDARFNYSVSELEQARVELSDLTSLLPEMKDYKLTVTGHDIPEEYQVIPTMLPTMVADLMISGKLKPQHERSYRERAAIALLPLWVEEIYYVSFTDPPKLTGKDISIELA